MHPSSHSCARRSAATATTARRTRRRRRMEWYRTKFIKTGSFGPVKHAMVRLRCSRSLSLFFSFACARLSLPLRLSLLLAGKKILPRWWDLFCLFLSLSLSFLCARIPLDASLTLSLSLLFSSIGRLERSWLPSG